MQQITFPLNLPFVECFWQFKEDGYEAYNAHPTRHDAREEEGEGVEEGALREGVGVLLSRLGQVAWSKKAYFIINIIIVCILNWTFK